MCMCTVDFTWSLYYLYKSKPLSNLLHGSFFKSYYGKVFLERSVHLCTSFSSLKKGGFLRINNIKHRVFRKHLKIQIILWKTVLFQNRTKIHRVRRKSFACGKIQIICRINKNMPEPNLFLSLWEQLCIMMKHSPQTSLEMNMIRIIRNNDGKE